MRAFFQQMDVFVRERLELRGKMDEPTLKKYRTVFGIHVRVSLFEIYRIIILKLRASFFRNTTIKASVF